MARSCNMNNVLLDVVSTGKLLKRITQEELKHVYGDIRISDKSGNFRKVSTKEFKIFKRTQFLNVLFEPDPFILLLMISFTHH